MNAAAHTRLDNYGHREGVQIVVLRHGHRQMLTISFAFTRPTFPPLPWIPPAAADQVLAIGGLCLN